MMVWTSINLGEQLERISAKESLGYYEMKQYKPWFHEGCAELLVQRKQALSVPNKWK
jgi:hypothetical protein